jgi:hypothetical protein
MSETSNRPHEHEKSNDVNRIELRRGRLRMRVSAPPYIPKDKALAEHGINGDVILTFSFPQGDDPTQPAKEVAFVDYGPDATDENPIPVLVTNGSPATVAGMAASRYGLQALNYVPKSHLSTYVEMPPNVSVTLGHMDTRNDFLLALCGDEEVGNENTSDRHVVVTTGKGIVEVVDYSDNGTIVRCAPADRGLNHWPEVVQAMPPGIVGN